MQLFLAAFNGVHYVLPIVNMLQLWQGHSVLRGVEMCVCVCVCVAVLFLTLCRRYLWSHTDYVQCVCVCVQYNIVQWQSNLPGWRRRGAHFYGPITHLSVFSSDP